LIRFTFESEPTLEDACPVVGPVTGISVRDAIALRYPKIISDRRKAEIFRKDTDKLLKLSDEEIQCLEFSVGFGE
jgi:hypothetical protein